MKYLFITLFFFQLSFCQNDISIKIINDTIKKVSIYDDNNILLELRNNSNNSYSIVLNPLGFNTSLDNYVEPVFTGLLDYDISENNALLTPLYGLYNSDGFHDLIRGDDYETFKKKYADHIKEPDVDIAYQIYKNTIFLAPKERKVFSIKIDFPIYKSKVDKTTKFYDLKNNHFYNLEISLNNPKEVLERYFIAPETHLKKAKIFTGKIHSNRVPLIYRVYNDK